MTHERISLADPPLSRLGHEARYHLAAGYIKPGDVVVDAGCGTGYGAEIIGPCAYVGVDRDLSLIEVDRSGRDFLAADLNSWQPDFPVDVAIVFETLEHLADPRALVAWTYNVRRLLFLSVPIRPTLAENPWHVRDYTPADVRALWAGMCEVAYFEQPAERSGIWVFAPCQW